MMIQRLDEDGEEFLPSRRVIMTISSNEFDDSDYTPKRSPDKGEEINRSNEHSGTKKSGDESSGSSSSSEDEGRKELTTNKDEVTSSFSDPLQRPCQPISQGNRPFSALADRLDALYRDHEKRNGKEALNG